MPIFYNVTSLLYGLIIGSFLNVVIYRLPREEKKSLLPRSTCPACGHKIAWYENIPVLSYLFLQGKCSSCKTKISLRYPIIELITGIFFMLNAPISMDFAALYLFIFKIIVFCLFLCMFMIDLDFQIIPDSLNLILALVFLFYQLRLGNWQFSLIGGLIGFIFPLGFTYLFYKLRGIVGLGGGDIKLFGALGLMLGPQMIIYNIFFSCFLGAIIGLILIALKRITKDKPFAFGPSIIIISFIQILYPDLFNQLLMRLF